MELTMGQRIFILKSYYETKSYNQVQTKFRTMFPERLLPNIIVIYLCIHGKCNPWDYVTMTRDVRLFKV